MLLTLHVLSEHSNSIRIIIFLFFIFVFSGRVDHFSRSVATVDLSVAHHRRSSDRARNTVLHTVHTDQSVHYFRHGHRGLLRASNGHVFSVLPYIQRDKKETKRLAESASHKQTTQVRFSITLLRGDIIITLILSKNKNEIKIQKRVWVIIIWVYDFSAIINTRNRGVAYGPNRTKPTRWIDGRCMRPVRCAMRTLSVHWYL